MTNNSIRFSNIFFIGISQLYLISAYICKNTILYKLSFVDELFIIYDLFHKNEK